MSAPSAPRARLSWRKLRLSTKICFLTLLLLLWIGILELAARVYWAVGQGAHGTSAAAIWRTNFEELPTCGIDEVAPYHGDDTFDVLLLGGSVVTPKYGSSIPNRLELALAAKLGRKVRVIACAYAGRTSLDSRMKYEHFADK